MGDRQKGCANAISEDDRSWGEMSDEIDFWRTGGKWLVSVGCMQTGVQAFLLSQY